MDIILGLCPVFDGHSTCLECTAVSARTSSTCLAFRPAPQTLLCNVWPDDPWPDITDRADTYCIAIAEDFTWYRYSAPAVFCDSIIFIFTVITWGALDRGARVHNSRRPFDRLTLTLTLTLTFDLLIFIGRRVIVMDYLCAKFGNFSFIHFGFIMRTHNHRGGSTIVTGLPSAWVIIIIIIIIIHYALHIVHHHSLTRDRCGGKTCYYLGKKISQSSGEVREASFLFKRCSVLVQRFNAILLHNSLPAPDCTDWWLYLPFFCLFLNHLEIIFTEGK